MHEPVVSGIDDLEQRRRLHAHCFPRHQVRKLLHKLPGPV